MLESEKEDSKSEKKARDRVRCCCEGGAEEDRIFKGEESYRS